MEFQLNCKNPRREVRFNEPSNDNREVQTLRENKQYMQEEFANWKLRMIDLVKE